MEDYCNDAVNLYKRVANVEKLRDAKTPFCPDGSLPAADDDVRGELAGNACRVLMKALWLARLARPDSQKPICDLATHLQSWSRNDDKRLYRLICYLNSSVKYRLLGQIQDPPEALKLLLFVDADFAGEVEDTKSTNGGLLVVAGPNSWFPISWLYRRQTSTSRSTTEAEVVSLSASLFTEALPFLTLWDIVLGRKVDLIILEDNQATIKVVRKGYSPKLRHISRTHKVNLGSIKEELEKPEVSIEYCHTTFQAADIFTKALAPMKWPNALKLLGIDTKMTFVKAASALPPFILDNFTDSDSGPN
jgi:hypothetical protein